MNSDKSVVSQSSFCQCFLVIMHRLESPEMNDFSERDEEEENGYGQRHGFGEEDSFDEDESVSL